jgi:hypothetical protein
MAETFKADLNVQGLGENCGLCAMARFYDMHFYVV